MLRLRLLGSLALEREDGSSLRSVLAQPKRFAVLAYLAASPSERPRDTLLGLFWAEKDREHARKALRQALYGLRQSLGPEVLTGKGEELVGVEPGRLRCDAAAFSSAIAEGRDRDALELYAGPFLEGFHLSGAPEFERWVDGKRRRLRTQATAAAWRLVEEAEARNDRAEARRRGDRALELAPYDGEGVRRYLSLMDRLGQPAAAVRAYEAYAERLAEDLDLRPSAETVDLLERIRKEGDGGASQPGEGGFTAAGRRPPGPEAASPGTRGRGPERASRASGRDDRREPPAGDARADLPDGGDEPPDVDEAPAPASASARGDAPATPAGLRSLVRSRRRSLLAAAAFLAFAVLASAGIAALGVDESPGAGMPRIRSLAVLPLDNYSGDPEQEYFTDGMTEALIAELGELGSLRVISRTTAMAYQGTEKSSPEIARELGADALIEGSVLKVGDEVRITLQLVHGPTDRHLWSKSYERRLRDVLALQGEVARNLAREMQLTIDPEAEARLARADPVDPQAYEAYLKGRYRYARVTEEDHRAALAHFREALAHDSTFAEAYAGLAVVCTHPNLLGSVTTLSECRRWADRAVQLAPDLAEAHAGLGRVEVAERDWTDAEASFRRAIELNPSSVMARFGYSELLWQTTRADEALEQIRRAERLDPLNLFVKTAVSWPLFVQGRYEEALAQLDEVLEMNPDFWLPLWNRGEGLVTLNRLPEALETARRLARLPAEEAHIASLALKVGAYGLAGRTAEALEILADLEQRVGNEMPARIGLLHARLGHQDEALDWFERAYRVRDPFLIAALLLPESDVLRDRPRFRALRRRVGLDGFGAE